MNIKEIAKAGGKSFAYTVIFLTAIEVVSRVSDFTMSKYYERKRRKSNQS